MRKLILVLLITITLFSLSSCKKNTNTDESFLDNEYSFDNELELDLDSEYSFDNELELEKTSKDEMLEIVNKAIVKSKQQKEGKCYISFNEDIYDIEYDFKDNNKKAIFKYSDNDQTSTMYYDDGIGYLKSCKYKMDIDIDIILEILFEDDKYISVILEENLPFLNNDSYGVKSTYGYDKNNNYIIDMYNSYAKLRLVFNEGNLIYLLGSSEDENIKMYNMLKDVNISFPNFSEYELILAFPAPYKWYETK